MLPWNAFPHVHHDDTLHMIKFVFLSLICTVNTVGGIQPLWGHLTPSEPYNPCDDLHYKGDASQDGEHDYVYFLPFPVWLQQMDAFENVDDNDDDCCVTNRVVIHIPVNSDFRVFLGP